MTPITTQRRGQSILRCTAGACVDAGSAGIIEMIVREVEYVRVRAEQIM